MNSFANSSTITMRGDKASPSRRPSAPLPRRHLLPSVGIANGGRHFVLRVFVNRTPATAGAFSRMRSRFRPEPHTMAPSFRPQNRLRQISPPPWSCQPEFRWRAIERSNSLEAARDLEQQSFPLWWCCTATVEDWHDYRVVHDRSGSGGSAAVPSPTNAVVPAAPDLANAWLG